MCRKALEAKADVDEVPEEGDHVDLNALYWAIDHPDIAEATTTSINMGTAICAALDELG